MKKISTLIVLFCAIFIGANAQYIYVPHINAGQNPGNLNQDAEYPVGGGIPAGWTSIQAGSAANPVWTANRSIPFSFNFNGTSFTRYKVATSGVLTFDTSAVTAPTYSRTTIPSALIPDNSIMVWGIKGTGTNDNIVTKTFGTAPNRQHWILFSSYTTVAGCASYWGIVLEETTNKIYIADMRNAGCAVSLTVGLQINSTTALKIYGSPALAQHATFDPSPADNSYYEFMIGTLPTANAELTALTTAHYALPPSNVNITGKITNFGSSPISTFVIKYEVGGNTYSNTKTGLNVASYASYSFTHNVPFNIAAAGPNNIKVWIELSGDVDQTNDTLSTMVSGLSFLPLKNIVFEEATGTWCGWCPRGAVFMDSLNVLHPDRAMLIAVHNGDVMSDAEYDAGVSSMVSGDPSGLVDRKSLDQDPQNFITLYNGRITAVVPCEVGVATTFDPGTRLLTVDVTGHFAGDLAGDYRFNAAITEDGVTGPGDGSNAVNNVDFDQVNYYSYMVNNQPLVGAGRNWQTSPDPVPYTEMVFNHVGRKILGGFKGLVGSTPSYITDGDVLTHTFTYTVPGTYNISNIHAIGWVCDGSTGEILNSNRTFDVTGISQVTQKSNRLVVYPNPSTGMIRVKSSVTGASLMKVKVMNSLGETVSSFEKMNFNNEQLIDLSKQNNGLYFIQFTDENNAVSVSRIVINR